MNKILSEKKCVIFFILDKYIDLINNFDNNVLNSILSTVILF